MKRFVLPLFICVLGGLLLIHAYRGATAATYVEFYWLSGAEGSTNQFCVGSLERHGSDNAFDLWKYIPTGCYGDGALNDLVAVRTAGYTGGGNATLRSDWFTGEHRDGCDYLEGSLTSVADGRARGTARYLHARYPGPPGYYGTLNLPASATGTAFAWGVGNLTDDSNCGGGWEMFHVHQGFNTGCLVAWGSMSAGGPYSTWSNLVHKITYTESVTPPC